MSGVRIGLVALGIAVAASGGAAAQSADVVRYYHSDAIGSVRMITDASQQVVARYDYLPFGEPWPAVPSAPNPRGFAGKEIDTETGFDYFGARYYGSGSGRFTTVDPVLDQQKALDDPQRWNRYAYARNNPFRYIDPDGAEITTPLAFQQQAFTQQVGANLRALSKVIINIGRSINSPGHMTPEAEARYFEQPESPAEATRMQFFDVLLTAAPLVFGRGANPARSSSTDLTSTADLQATHGFTMSRRAFNDLKQSIARDGIREPIKYVEHKGQKFVVDGHHRLRAAQALGIRKVPTQRVNLPYLGYQRPDDLINVDRLP